VAALHVVMGVSEAQIHGCQAPNRLRPTLHFFRFIIEPRNFPKLAQFVTSFVFRTSALYTLA
jgi:hypothetical protein